MSKVQREKGQEMLTLLTGVVLSPGHSTEASALKVMGFGGDCNYFRRLHVLSRAA